MRGAGRNGSAALPNVCVRVLSREQAAAATQASQMETCSDFSREKKNILQIRFSRVERFATKTFSIFPPLTSIMISQRRV